MKKIYISLLIMFLFSTGYSQLIINEVLYDPSNNELDGDANGDGVYDQEGDSFIEFYNIGWFDFDASGFQIWDDTLAGAQRYVFPPNTIIPPFSALVVFGGGNPVGEFGGSMLLTADTSAVGLNLNNSGEVIVIKDSLDNVVLTFDSDALSNNPNESYTRYPDISGDFLQHGDTTNVLFSPGTKADGTAFGTFGDPALSLLGILDLDIPGVAGKAVHVTASADIADMSLYGIGVANNGGGTDGFEYIFPPMSMLAGEHLLLAREPDAMAAYFGNCLMAFDHVLVANSDISQNGDDAIELFFAGNVIETFGDIDVDATGEAWEYKDSWAYKIEGEWTFGGVECTDGAATNLASSCPYPFCPEEENLVTSITIQGEGGAASINTPGGSLQMMVTVLPENAIDKSVSWNIENQTGFGIMNDDGLLTAVADGEVVVWAYANDGSGVKDSLVIVISGQATLDPALELKGILDLSQSGSTGKAIHVLATTDIENLSLYGIGVANNGNGTDGQEYTFPAISMENGQHLLVARDTMVMATYFEDCMAEFDHVLVANTNISQNGDDAIELFFTGSVIETFGDIDVDGTGEAWEYLDSWAYKIDGEWTFGGVDCTDGAATNAEATCPYPLCEGTSVKDTESFISFEVYPNPAGDFIQFSSNDQPEYIEILSLSGQKILVNGIQSGQLKLSGLDSGTYIIRAVFEDRILYKKLIKK